MSEIAHAPTDTRMSGFFWIGLLLLCVGTGPLLIVILAAQLGLTRDPNPNPVGFGILALFAETGARAVVSLSQASLAHLLTIAAQYKVAAFVIGRVTRGQFQLSLNGATVVRDHSASLREIWGGASNDRYAMLGGKVAPAFRHSPRRRA